VPAVDTEWINLQTVFIEGTHLQLVLS